MGERGTGPESGARARVTLLPTMAFLWSLVAFCWLVGGILNVLLLAFAGVLLGLILRGAGEWVARLTRLPASVGVALVCLGAVAFIAGGVWLIAPALAEQVDALTKTLPQAASDLAVKLEHYDWGKDLVDRVRHASLVPRGDTLSQAGGILSTTFGAVAGFIVLFFVALFVAFDPLLYRDGLLRLVPLSHRRRVAVVLADTGRALRMWMLGKIIAMVAVGIATWVVLVALGIPLALSLALLAAVLTFIPNFGPLLSLAPAVLLAFMSSPTKAVYVLVLYVVIQSAESYLLTPLVQRRTVSLPPAVTLVGQIVMGAVAGPIGLFVATPLIAAALVLIEHFYVEDALGDRGSGDGDENGRD